MPPEFDLAQRRRLLRLERPDAILMIKGRHPLNRPELYGMTPCLFVLDDADYLGASWGEQTLAACRDAAAATLSSIRCSAGISPNQA